VSESRNEQQRRQAHQVIDMLQFNPALSLQFPVSRASRKAVPEQSGDKNLEARVKRECVQLYPGVDPDTWYQVVQEGEYRDDMEGLWIQVSDWVTYVLAQHFDLQARPGLH
jgi:hypothetical protein